MTPFETLQQQYPWPKEPPPCGVKMHGWNDASNIVASVVAGCERGIELGSWFGQSALAMVSTNARLQLVCIDHWQGSKEHQNDEAYTGLIAESYDRFLCNLWAYRERVVPMRQRTIDGMMSALDSGFVPDYVYVDATHDYESVVEDVRWALNFWPKAILFGDDYSCYWPDVQRAVNDVAAIRHKTVEMIGTFTWSYR